MDKRKCIHETDCHIIQDILPLYLDHVVSPETSSLVKEHLKDCPECRQMYESLAEKTILPVNPNLRQEDVLQLEKHFKKENRRRLRGKTAGIILLLLFSAAILTAIVWFQPFHPFSETADLTEDKLVEEMYSSSMGGIYAREARISIQKILPQVRVRRSFHVRNVHELPSDTVYLRLIAGTSYLDCWLEPDEKVYLYAGDQGSIVSYEVLNPELLQDAVKILESYPDDSDYENILDLYLDYPNSLSTGLSDFSQKEITDWKEYLEGIFTENGKNNFGFDEEKRQGERFRYETAAKTTNSRLQYSDIIWNWDGQQVLSWQTEVTWFPPAEYGWPQAFEVSGEMTLDDKGRIDRFECLSDDGLLDILK